METALADQLTMLVARAGEAVLDIARSGFAVRFKADASPVTAADEASQAILLEGLARLMPGLPVVAEETAGIAPPPVGTTLALVDPLDGTQEFIAGLDEFTVNLALIVDGAPHDGFIGVPSQGRVYRGGIGRPAERVTVARGAPTPIEVTAIASRTPARAGLVAAVSRSHLDRETEAFLSALPVSEQAVCGSALKFCLLAEGKVDIYPRLAPTWEWDIAAGHALVAAAGGAMARPDKTPLRYGRAEAAFLVPSFVAWGDPALTAR